MKTTLIPLFLLTLLSCSKADVQEPELPIPPKKNYFQNKVDSLILVGALKVGEPFKVKRYPGDDETYDINVGYSSRFTTTALYVKENTWLIKEKYRDIVNRYIIMHRNNHDIYLVKVSDAIYNSPDWELGKFVSGSVLFPLMDANNSGQWDL